MDMNEDPARTLQNPYWEMFKFIEGADRPTTTEIAKAMRISVRTARDKLKSLKAAGFVFCDGRNPGFLRSPRHEDGTWTARNAYSGAMLAKSFPIPRKAWPRTGDSQMLSQV